MLIKCPECGKDLSDKADKCPNCGCPIEDIKNIYTASDPAHTEILIRNMRRYADCTDAKLYLMDRTCNNSLGKRYVNKVDSFYTPNPLKVGGIVGVACALIGIVGNLSEMKLTLAHLAVYLIASIITALLFGGITAVIVLLINSNKKAKKTAANQYIADMERFKANDKEIENIDISEIPQNYRNAPTLRGLSNILEQNQMMSVEGAILQYEKQTEERERKENERKQMELLEYQTKLLTLNAQISAVTAKAVVSRNLYDALKDLLR